MRSVFSLSSPHAVSLKHIARQLRKDQTDEERQLWRSPQPAFCGFSIPPTACGW